MRKIKNKAGIIEDLRRLGLKEGDSVCVHSSLRSIGEVEGGATAVIEALLETVGPEGTLMFPAFTFYLLNEDAPLWIYEESPSCVGYLSELFRARYAQKRSIHLSHSYSMAGRFAEEFSRHPLDVTPCGKETPLAKLMQSGGKILMIGCGLNSLTAIHVFEEKMQAPYVRFRKAEKAKYSLNGAISPLPSQVVYPFSYDFERLEPHFKARQVARHGKIGQADSRLLDGPRMTDCVLGLLSENPLFLSNN